MESIQRLFNGLAALGEEQYTTKSNAVNSPFLMFGQEFGHEFGHMENDHQQTVSEMTDPV